MLTLCFAVVFCDFAVTSVTLHFAFIWGGGGGGAYLTEEMSDLQLVIIPQFLFFQSFLLIRHVIITCKPEDRQAH
jgi:hypothetical protein